MNISDFEDSSVSLETIGDFQETMQSLSFVIDGLN